MTFNVISSIFFAIELLLFFKSIKHKLKSINSFEIEDQLIFEFNVNLFNYIFLLKKYFDLFII